MVSRVRLAIAGLLLLTLILLVLFSQPPKSGKEPPPPAPPRASIQLLASGLAGSNAGQMAYFILQANNSGLEEANMTLGALPRRPPLSAYLIPLPPSAPAQAQGSYTALLFALPSHGLMARAQHPDYQSVSDSLLIVQGGIMPAQIYGNLSRLLANRNRVIYSGIGFEYLLREDGTILRAGANSTPALLAGKECNYLLDDSGGWLCALPPPSSYESARPLALQIERLSLFGPDSGAYAKSPYPYEGKITYFIPAPGNPAYAQAAYFFAGKGVWLRGSFLSPLPPPSGSIQGRLETYPGQLVSLALSANESFESPVELQFKVDVSRNGERAFSVPAGTGRVREVWIGEAEFQSPAMPGEYLLELTDQFGRRAAASRLLVRNLSARLLSVSESAYEIEVLRDNIPVDSELAIVRILGSNSSERYPVSHGRLTVFAKPLHPGNFSIQIGGAIAQAPFQPPRNPNEAYLLPAIALLLAAIAVLALRQPGRGVLRIFVPEQSEGKGGSLALGAGQVTRMLSRTAAYLSLGKSPLSLAEIMLGARKFAHPHREIFVSDSNLQQLLDSFAPKTLSSYGDYYWPAQWGLGDAKRAVMMRKIADSQIERGVAARRAKAGIITKTSLGETLLVPFSGKKALLSALGAKRRPTVAVFESPQDILEFKRSLLLPGEENIRLSIALKTNALLALPISSLGDAL